MLIDESNDRGVEAKDLVVMLRFFDPTVMRAVTRFLDLPTANDGTAAAIFEKVNGCLNSCNLSYDQLVCFNSDTCNTMKGQRNGVVRYLLEKQPAMIDFGCTCICHLESLSVVMTEEGMAAEVTQFLAHVRIFYSTFVKKLINKFPFNSSFLSDLRVLNPSERTTYRDLPNAVIRLANQLPQLQLRNKLDDLKTEAVDFQMADEADLPPGDDVDDFWAKLHYVKGMGRTYNTNLLIFACAGSCPSSPPSQQR